MFVGYQCACAAPVWISNIMCACNRHANCACMMCMSAVGMQTVSALGCVCMFWHAKVFNQMWVFMLS